VTQSPESKYLGSTTESTKTVVIATDEPTIRVLWKIPDDKQVFEKYREVGPTTRATTRPTVPRGAGQLPRDIR
jgi:hypothetical protein